MIIRYFSHFFIALLIFFINFLSRTLYYAMLGIQVFLLHINFVVLMFWRNHVNRSGPAISLNEIKFVWYIILDFRSFYFFLPTNSPSFHKLSFDLFFFIFFLFFFLYLFKNLKFILVDPFFLYDLFPFYTHDWEKNQIFYITSQWSIFP